jgi:hypothetical protein
MTPIVDETTSKLESPYGISSAAPTSKRMSRPRSAARSFARSNQYRRQIHSRHVRSALGREEAEVSRSAARVEPLHARPRFEPFDDELVHVR